MSTTTADPTKKPDFLPAKQVRRQLAQHNGKFFVHLSPSEMRY